MAESNHAVRREPQRLFPVLCANAHRLPAEQRSWASQSLLPGGPLLVIYIVRGERSEVKVFLDEHKKRGRELLRPSGSYREAAHRSWFHETGRVDFDECARAVRWSTNVGSSSSLRPE